MFVSVRVFVFVLVRVCCGRSYGFCVRSREGMLCSLL